LNRADDIEPHTLAHVSCKTLTLRPSQNYGRGDGRNLRDTWRTHSVDPRERCQEYHPSDDAIPTAPPCENR
jgi:hypothetical protein